jgi:hypothetical protein
MTTAADSADKTEAKEQVALIDKTVNQIQAFMKAQANQPPAPATPTEPAAGTRPAGTSNK